MDISGSDYEHSRAEIEQYAERYTSELSPVLQKLYRQTYLRVTAPQMISGPLQGKFLEMISKIIRPQQVLDIGTYTGFSALCFAGGLAENGVVHTIDSNPELEDMIREYIMEAGMLDHVHLHLGNAVDIIPKLKGPFDLVFIDADKPNYIKYYEMSLEKTRRGGYILADNVLWYGQVLKQTDLDEDARGIVEFNDHVNNDPRTEHVFLPFRDGLMMMRKK
ncbi:MAG: O-methyltransferase [Bacteroidales bacterium]|nr:O-methyltransferase [Bacteroidales bacterium]